MDKADSVILLDFESRPTINPEIAGAIFEKIETFIFYVNTLNFGGKGKLKKFKIFARRLQISNLNEIGRLF